MDKLIVPITRVLSKKPFDCGIDELNQYFRLYALTNDKKNVGKTFVAVLKEEPSQPIGYYTLSMVHILFDELPEELKKGLPRYPVPAMRLGKLAISLNHQKQGLGAFLLKDVLLKAIDFSEKVGLKCLLVDALNDRAKLFYQKFGFLPFPSNSLTLVLPIETIIEAEKK